MAGLVKISGLVGFSNVKPNAVCCSYSHLRPHTIRDGCFQNVRGFCIQMWEQYCEAGHHVRQWTTTLERTSKILGVTHYLFVCMSYFVPQLAGHPQVHDLFSKSVGFRITPPCQLSAGWRQQSGPLPDSLVHWFIFSLTLKNPTNPLILTNPTTNPIIKTD